MRMTVSRFVTAMWFLPVLASCGSDPTGPTTQASSGSSCEVVNLLPGQDAVFAGSAAVDCVRLPSFDADARYELVVSSMSRSLGFSRMQLRLTPDGSTIPATPSSAIAPIGTTAGSGQGDALRAAWRRGQTSLDAELRTVERGIQPQIRAAATTASVGLFAVPSPGDTMRYRFSCVDGSRFPNAPTSILGEVRHVSRRAVIVEDRNSPNAFTADEYAAIAQVFDDVIFDTNVKYFGEPADIDANGGRIVLLYSGGVNRMSEDYGASFIAGFTCPLDLGASSGNRAEMFYLMVPDPQGLFTDASDDAISKEQVRRITDNTVAHEFQHLINAQSGNGGAQDVWLNEGLSHLAEEAVGHAVNGFEPGSGLGPDQLVGTQERIDTFNKFYLNNWYNLSQYLRAPADTAALLNSTDPLNRNTFRMRGAAWSFLRYLLDRYESGSGPEAARTRALVQSGAQDSRDAIEEVFGESFDRLATRWSTMLVSADRPDFDPSADLELRSYRLREVFTSRIGEAVNPPSGGYPLRPVAYELGGRYEIDTELFSATSLYVGLEAREAGEGTMIGLVTPGTRAPLHASVEPRLQILRIR